MSAAGYLGVWQATPAAAAAVLADALDARSATYGELIELQGNGWAATVAEFSPADMRLAGEPDVGIGIRHPESIDALHALTTQMFQVLVERTSWPVTADADPDGTFPELQRL